MKTVTYSRTGPAGLETGGAFSLPVLAHVGLLNRGADLPAPCAKGRTRGNGGRVTAKESSLTIRLHIHGYDHGISDHDFIFHVAACVGSRLALESGRGT